MRRDALFSTLLRVVNLSLLPHTHTHTRTHKYTTWARESHRQIPKDSASKFVSNYLFFFDEDMH